MSEPGSPICRRCGRAVVTYAADYSIFEGMHYVCFHYEFEHELGAAADPDVDCGVPGCPSGPLPTKAPSEVAEGLLREIAELLRDPHSASGREATMERPGVLIVHGAEGGVRLLAFDVPPQT